MPRRVVSISLVTLAVAMSVSQAGTVAQVDPFQSRVEPTTFANATVTDVLHHISKSRDARPYWRFHIATQELADTRVSMTIGENHDLGQVLATLTEQLDAKYRWHWHKSCGSEVAPFRAVFSVSNKSGDEPPHGVIWIDRDSVQKWGPNLEADHAADPKPNSDHR